MKKFSWMVCLLAAFTAAQAQPHSDRDEAALKKIYQETPEMKTALVHTKLDVRFDYEKAWMYGKAWITLKPYFYASNEISLDAKGMAIQEVSLVEGTKQQKLKYNYDGYVLTVQLNKRYGGGEPLTLYIDYIAKPNELVVKGSAAITDAKGLYFVNPTGKEKNKPTQIWTQGETEATSVWCPTIDRPNQKTTQEIYMTVPAKYVTLSNGLLVSQKNNSNGTRTDYWKMDLPHAPYLFFMGVGEYAVIKDSYKKKEVAYYVEKEYANVARKIFGNTPEMMAYFSSITGVDYPWAKYAQITGRDYVSGAMENTTATLHQESAQQDARELVDGNAWEGTIAHELFHHWFGDYVTAESWSNLTINESFANYSQTLWFEYKYGKDAGDAENFSDMSGYLQSGSEKKDLVRFDYQDKEDMFDAVSYNKGGRILHMLRNYVGDSAFFKSLNHFLTTNKFQAAEAHQLRLSFEKVTGKDLNWFFNQWYFNAGHPKLTINYDYDDAAKQVKVTLLQTQDSNNVFRLPFAIDVYNGAKATRHQVEMTSRSQTFTLPYNQGVRPDLVNVDADKILLCEKKENKNLAQYVHQYTYAPKYLDRREAIDFLAKQQDDPLAQKTLVRALNDPYYGLRSHTLGKLDLKKTTIKDMVEPNLVSMAKNDPKSTVRAKAISMLGSYKNESYQRIFEQALTDSSYSVAGSGLEALYKSNEAAAIKQVQTLKNVPAKGKLNEQINGILIKSGSEADFDFIAGSFDKLPLGQEKFEMMQPFAEYLAKLTNTDQVKKGVDMIADFRDGIPAAYQQQTSPFINNVILNGLATKKKAQLNGPNASNIQQQIDYINARKEGKKGF
jgi:aminopeptidase N